MKVILKNIISFILPVTVLVLVPRWIETDWTIASVSNLIFGIALASIGLFTIAATITSFIRIGKGTLAPWSPTKRLVLTGLYRYVRNPMILGVFTVLLGETIFFASFKILCWSGTFFLINTIYFILFEEPQLEKRFGREYTDYKQKVGRWMPRLTPYQSNSEK